MLKTSAVFLAAALLTGCAASNPPAPSRSNNPANPNAPEAPLWQSSTALPSAYAAISATTTPSLYTCPMHAQVVTDGPGKCPICHMTLVPKK